MPAAMIASSGAWIRWSEKKYRQHIIITIITEIIFQILPMQPNDLPIIQIMPQQSATPETKLRLALLLSASLEHFLNQETSSSSSPIPQKEQ